MLRRLTHLLTCRDATRLISRLQDERGSLAERWKLRLHLLACDACRRFSAQLHLLAETMRRYRS